MGHRRGRLNCKVEGFEEKHSPSASQPVYPETSPPPSYHSFEGLRPDQTTRSAASVDTDARKREREHGTVSQHPHSRNEELAVNRRPRRDRRKHHRPRSSSSLHNSSWTAKLVFQGLRSGFSGSSSSDHTRRGSSRGPTTSRTTKLDFSKTSRDIHYTVHNHWHDMSPSEPLSRHKTWPGREASRAKQYPFAHLMSGALPTFGSDEQDEHSRRQGVAGQPLCQEHQASFNECLFSGTSSRMPEEIDTGSPFQNVFVNDFAPCPADTRCHDRPPQQIWWDKRPGAQQTFANESKRGSHDFIGNGNPSPKAPFGTNRSNGHVRESDSSYERRYSSNAQDCEDDTQGAACQLAAYNQRWNYLDTVQQPYPLELPWPAIRPDLSFDHMKCDVFSFFARGCSLEPDSNKAPKLDFKIPPPSPYSSYDRRQQEWRRKMLTKFKRQMQKEKLHWHEDKLRRKFPEAIERDDGRRKAVWAAIAEGSAICDKRLGSML